MHFVNFVLFYIMDFHLIAISPVNDPMVIDMGTMIEHKVLVGTYSFLPWLDPDYKYSDDDGVFQSTSLI